MSDVLPELYFRLRDNGAAVFRVDNDGRARRLELDQVATVNLRHDEIRAQGGATLTEAETAAIRDWMAQRRAQLAARESEEIERTIEALNRAAHWAQSEASDTALDAVTDRMLLAMHDLRATLIRRKAESLSRAEGEE